MNNQNLQREISLLPRVTPEEMLTKIQRYYCFIGAIGDSQIADQNSQINNFALKAKKMLNFLDRFRINLMEMEVEFESGV